MIYLICIMLVTFGIWVHQEARDQIGLSMIFTVLVMMTLNVALILLIALRAAKLVLLKIKNNKKLIKASISRSYLKTVQQWKRFENWFNSKCEDNEVSSDNEEKVKEEVKVEQNEKEKEIKPVNNILIDEEDP